MPLTNVTTQYPNSVFLAPAITTLQTQVNLINNTGVINKDFPKKIRRVNIGLAPDGTGSLMSQIDAIITPGTTSLYSFASLGDAQRYCLEGAAQMVNNASYYIESFTTTTYSMLVWGLHG